MSRDPKTHVVNVRFSDEQYERLKAVADDRFGGNVSDAVRQAVTDAEALRLARQDYFFLVREQGLRLPRYATPDGANEGETTTLETILSPFFEMREML